MLGETLETPSEVLAPGIETLQAIGDVDGERLVVLPRGAVGLVPDLAEPAEPREPGDFAQDDHQQREQDQRQQPGSRPADPIVARDQRQHVIVEPERGEQADETAKRADQDTAPAEPAAEVRHGAPARHRQRFRLRHGGWGRRQEHIDLLDAEGGGFAVRFLAHAKWSPISV